MLRAIHIFPKFADASAIHTYRAKYDPLHNLIDPHMTLVFPFESEMEITILEHHVQTSICGIPPFRVVLQGVTGADGEYLFLNVKRGNDEIIMLHDRLYIGLLAPFLNRLVTYTPHLTIGRLTDKVSFGLALHETERLTQKFETTVCEIAIESISITGASKLEAVIGLN